MIACFGPVWQLCWFSLFAQSTLVQIGLLVLPPLTHSQARQAPLALANKNTHTNQDLVSQVALRLSLKLLCLPVQETPMERGNQQGTC